MRGSHCSGPWQLIGRAEAVGVAGILAIIGCATLAAGCAGSIAADDGDPSGASRAGRTPASSSSGGASAGAHEQPNAPAAGGSTAGLTGPSGGAPAPAGVPAPPASPTASPSPQPLPGPAPGTIPAPSSPAGRARGILDCPTVPYPGTSVSAMTAAVLSEPFTKVCAPCHGGAGEGKGAYPGLPGTLSREEFVAKVRGGTANMPAFPSSLIDDAALGRDFDTLRARALAGQGQDGAHPALRWSAAEVAQKRAAGLALWRKPDKEGMACANCHSADAIDLAVIGYPDAAIMRRGLLHLQAGDVLGIVDFVHAQRRHYGVEQPCSPAWRVLQPGGEVLPGVTAKEQDQALWGELVRRGLLVATTKIATIDEADRAFAELAALNMRRLRTGIALPRWTEDRFNGDDHRTINDWIAAVPRLPRGPEWYAQVDAYLADPTDARLAALLANLDKLTHDGGFAKLPWAEGDLSAVMTSKYLLVQVAAHYFRLALQGKPGWFEQAEAPPALPSTRGEVTNPFMSIGFAFQENHCYNQPACPPGQYAALPPIAKVEFDPKIGMAAGSTAGVNFAFVMQKELTHSWWTLSGLWDPSFGGGRDLAMHYWLEAGSSVAPNFPHRTYHRPFLMAVAMVKRAVALERSKPGVSGVLNGNTMMGFDNPIGSAIGATPENTRLIANLMNLTLLRMRRELLAGKPVAAATKFTSGHGLGDWPAGLEKAATAGRWEPDHLRATAALARDVLGLLAKAPAAR